MFVGVMALVPLVPWYHSVDADIGLGPPVSPRPFREVVAFQTWWIVRWSSFFGPCFGSFRPFGFSVHIPFFRFHFGFAP